MITITIDNAGATPAHELRAVAQCLITIADASVDKVDAPDLADVKKSFDAQIKAFDAPIAAEDRPDTGAPEASFPESVAAFVEPIGEALRELDPKVVFGAVPNVPAVPVSNTAAVEALPTVPAVPQAISTTPAIVPLPPVPPVPGVDAQTDEDAPSDAQFDKSGLPWDARIHSRGRSMTAAGVWRSKRGVDEATVAAVEAELRAVPGVPTVTTLAEDVATAEASWPFQPLAGAAVPPPPPPVAVVSFPAFMGKYVPLVTAGKITQAQITEILVAHGVPNLPLLSARTDLLPTIAAQLDALIAA